jgi:hypothetical protein
VATTRYRTHYIPATNAGRHNRGRARYDIPPSKNETMAEFLLSEQLMQPVMEAAEAIASDARALAATDLISDERSGAYEASIKAERNEPVVAGGAPRVSAAVTANGGNAHWSGPIGPETSHAVVVEFDVPEGSDAGPRPREGRRILGRSGAPYHTPKAPK